jgi:8-oxo-dGTP pyrophosphatase MutT (NUDIX family)
MPHSRGRKQRRARDIERDIVALELSQLRAAHPGYNIRCGVLLLRADGRVLMVRENARCDYAGGIIGPPKGTAVAGDRDYRGVALRELFEETGIRAADVAPVGPEIVIVREYFRDVLFIFPFATRADDIAARADGREISECCWMSLAEIERAGASESTSVRRLFSCVRALMNECAEVAR